MPQAIRIVERIQDQSDYAGTAADDKILEYDSATGKFTPVFPSGEFYEAENKDSVTLNAGQPVATHSSGTGVVRANATDNSKPACGLVKTGSAAAVASKIQTDGLLTLADWTNATGTTALSAGARYYLSATVGLLTTTPPSSTGNVVQLVGKAVSLDTLRLEIEEEILL